MNKPSIKIELDDKKALLAILLAMVFIYLDYSFVLRMQLRGLRNSGENIVRLEGQISALSGQLAGMRREKARLAQEKEESAAKAKKFITQQQVPSLLEEIAEDAKASGVELLQMSPLRERPAGAKKFYPLSINLALSCGYHGLGRFLNALENKKEFIGVQELSVSAVQNDYFKHRVGLTLKVYVEEKS